MVYFPAETLWCFSKRVWSRHFSHQRSELAFAEEWLYLWRDINLHGLDADVFRVCHRTIVVPTDPSLIASPNSWSRNTMKMV